MGMDKEERKYIVRCMMMMSQIGITAIVCIALGVFLGVWADRLLGTAPVFILLLSLSGCAAAIKAMIDIAKKF